MSEKIVISMGDYNGIGPEVILKSFSSSFPSGEAVVILGHPDVFSYYANTLDMAPGLNVIDSLDRAQHGSLNLLQCCDDGDITLSPGTISESAGRAAMKAVEYGIDACLSGDADALVTAPISKEAIHKAGYTVPGHTEFLAEKADTRQFMMILASGNLRVGLVTGHIPLQNVSAEITPELILNKLETLHLSLMRDFGINKPRIAVFGLNPHAGDGGVLGTEEIEIITPALARAEESGIEADGPLPADGFFGSGLQKKYDGILAMYHDQGLVPFKALSFGSGVNFTAGLPFIRTSPDHGTAFGLAGENRADARSFSEAFRLASDMVRNRKKAVKTNDG
ncbi:4-hydroxythreonine-4-phosphate dehydrogenase PdxA [Rhodohalobacter mucosus]|uniref:4-hydroxythreonine-4-phosphate dehydrogenase PdxA n=1 Tax=Rhodohalobacter mucosus TaxID=2079485 RepID=A0A316TRL7_9BACT|nr:4-hydroxythreonine-4-phosphate dehydrogenase PdxA [Rhodohalobacter mucosus]PWN07060.1 4-hydroxythreonine-4-phosphate dehydrogenase PdxA [Rhodohalobacter mucosus]